MKITARIETVSSVVSGVSQSGNNYRSCSIIAVVDREEFEERFLIHCLNERCDAVQDIVKAYADSNGNIVGLYDIFFLSEVRFWENAKGEQKSSQENKLRIIRRAQ